VLPAFTIAQIYKCRWQVELFFKWIKQHLRIKAFYGTSENAVKTQIWIAVSIYALVAIVRKRLGLAASLYQTPQILSVTLFEKTPFYAPFRLPKQMPNLPKTLTNLFFSTFSRTAVSFDNSPLSVMRSLAGAASRCYSWRAARHT
jgi:hypothetical protein